MNFALLAGFFFGIGATIRIGWEMLCLPYAGFLQIERMLPSGGVTSGTVCYEQGHICFL